MWIGSRRPHSFERHLWLRRRNEAPTRSIPPPAQDQIQLAPAFKTDSHRHNGLTRIRDGWIPADLQHLSALSTPARRHWTTGHTSRVFYVLPPYSLTPLIQRPRSIGQPTTFSTLRRSDHRAHTDTGNRTDHPGPPTLSRIANWYRQINAHRPKPPKNTTGM